MNAQEIATRARTSSETSNGCWCIYVPLSDTEGLKLYPDRRMRDEAVRLQSKAAKFGVGPEVKNRSVELPLLESWYRPMKWVEQYPKVGIGSILYGYVTEVVEEDVDDEDLFDDLISRLKEYGIAVTDLSHNSNVGMTNDGRAVMFDFDPVFYHGVDRMSEIT